MKREGFKVFIENVRKKILNFMPEEYQYASTRITYIPKNNEEKAALGIDRKNGRAIPALYMEQYYEMILMGHTEAEVLEKIAKDYQKLDHSIPQSIGKPVKNFEMVKDRLWVELVEKVQRRIDFSRAVYKEIKGTDLVAIFRIRTNFKELDSEDMVIGKELLEQWECDEDSLYHVALKNFMLQMPAQITGAEFHGEEDFEKVLCEIGEVYMLTNAGQKYGASTFLYPGVLQKLARNSGKGFFILPTSKHEVMLMRADEEVEGKELQRIVIEGNYQENRSEDVLSNRVYYYDADTQKLSYATTEEETVELLKEFLGS